jgi:hypothetical protein
MSVARCGGSCTPDPLPSPERSSSIRTVIIVITIHAFVAFFITRGYPLQVALAASSAICVLAHRVSPRSIVPGRRWSV